MELDLSESFLTIIQVVIYKQNNSCQIIKNHKKPDNDRYMTNRLSTTSPEGNNNNFLTKFPWLYIANAINIFAVDLQSYIVFRRNYFLRSIYIKLSYKNSLRKMDPFRKVDPGEHHDELRKMWILR